MSNVPSPEMIALLARAMVVIDRPEQIQAPVLKRLFAYWSSKRADGQPPPRTAIDPADLRDILPYLWLVDVEREPWRFRFRLVGTKITEWAGREYTGRYVETEAYGPQAPTIAAQYREVAERCLPMWHQQHAPWIGREFRFYEKVMLPLLAPGGNVGMLLCAMSMTSAPAP